MMRTNCESENHLLENEFIWEHSSGEDSFQVCWSNQPKVILNGQLLCARRNFDNANTQCCLCPLRGSMHAHRREGFHLCSKEETGGNPVKEPIFPLLFMYILKS